MVEVLLRASALSHVPNRFMQVHKAEEAGTNSDSLSKRRKLRGRGDASVKLIATDGQRLKGSAEQPVSRYMFVLRQSPPGSENKQ